MRILLLCHSFNSLTQRLHVALREAGHEVLLQVPMEPFDYPDNDPAEEQSDCHCDYDTGHDGLPQSGSAADDGRRRLPLTYRSSRRKSSP